MKFLLVEDEPKLASFIKKGMENESFEMDIAYDGQTGLSMFQKNTYDLAILDVNLPVMNGFELCRYIRKHNEQIPVLMLTALDSIEDKVQGFESGADDYLAKPFHFKELLMRSKVLAKRNNRKAESVLYAADLELDMNKKSVIRAGERVDLTAREYALLEYLMLNKGKIVSRVDISESVWNLDFDTNTNLIDVYISYLRKKIDKDHPKKLLHTIVGMGYVLRED
jgi:two-component system copper resistance phosphate regulon response regulator CusR